MSLPKPIEGNKSELFRPASETLGTDWEQAQNRRFVDLLRLSDYAVGHIMANVKEGVSYKIDVKVDGLALHLSVAGNPPPAPTTRSETKSSGSSSPVVSNQSLEEFVKANSDIEMRVVNGKQLVYSKRFLGDKWGQINEELKAIGLVWVRDSKNSHWEAP